MSNYTQLYWLTRLDSINSFFGVSVFISICIILLYIIIKGVEYGDNEGHVDFTKRYGWILKSSVIIGIMGIVGAIFVPTKNDMLLIYAGGKTMDYVQSDTSIAKIPYQTTKIISDYLDKTIK